MNDGEKLKIGIVQHFDSMHYLPGHAKCGTEHGHTYKVEISLEGPLQNGMVMDFDRLKEQAKSVIASFDHANLNKIVPYPSSENLCMELHRRLRMALDVSWPMTVRLWEGDGKWAEYTG